MPLLAKKIEITTDSLTVRLPTSTIELVKDYARFSNHPNSEVVDAMLLHAFSQDDDFQHWLKTEASTDKKKVRALSNAS
jgi:hypothetical protein